MKVFIQSYGCSNNQAEGQAMQALLSKNYEIAVNESEADIIVMNTCAVKNTTENKILHKIDVLRKQNKKLVIAGCMPHAGYNRIKGIAPLLSTNHIDKINEVVDAASQGTYVEFVGKNNLNKAVLPRMSRIPIDIIPISSGCLNSCTFCATKLAKGNLVSYPEDAIVEEIAKGKIGKGAKEFWLTSQDNGCYGFDVGSNLARLTNKITSSVAGKYFLRIGMANPQHIKRILPELIEAYKNEHVFKFIHVPVQSGSNSILRAMHRGHNSEDFTKIVNAFRNEMPEISIWTDMIVGFPGEREEDFEASLSLIKETKPDYVNVSSYSSRPGTPSAKLKQIATEIKKDRTTRMSDLVRSTALEKNNMWIGWQGEAIVDEHNKTWIARNYSYKPIAVEGDYELGQIINVEIVDAKLTCLIGRNV